MPGAYATTPKDGEGFYGITIGEVLQPPRTFYTYTSDKGLSKN